MTNVHRGIDKIQNFGGFLIVVLVNVVVIDVAVCIGGWLEAGWTLLDDAGDRVMVLDRQRVLYGGELFQRNLQGGGNDLFVCLRDVGHFRFPFEFQKYLVYTNFGY